MLSKDAYESLWIQYPNLVSMCKDAYHGSIICCDLQPLADYLVHNQLHGLMGWHVSSWLGIYMLPVI